MGNRSADFRISKRDFGEPMCVARGWGEHHALQLEDDLACMKQWRCEKNEFNPEPDQRCRTGIFSAIAAEDGACARVAIGIPDRASEDAREKDSRLDWKSRPVARPAESASVQRGDESKSFGGGSLEARLGAYRNEARVKLQSIFAGLVVVIIQANAEVVAEVIAKAGAGSPATS